MEHRRRSRSGSAQGSLSKAHPLGHIQELIDNGGHITIGRVDPIDSAAVAWDGKRTVAMLQQNTAELLPDLIKRLDKAIQTAWNSGHAVDEINS